MGGAPERQNGATKRLQIRDLRDYLICNLLRRLKFRPNLEISALIQRPTLFEHLVDLAKWVRSIEQRTAADRAAEPLKRRLRPDAQVYELGGGPDQGDDRGVGYP